MGQGPSRSKFTVRDENVRIKYAASSMKGYRSYMEDAHETILDLDGARTTSFFGVYDGHGGANVAKYCANQFHTELLKDGDRHNNLAEAVRRVFFRMDEQLKENDGWRTLANPRRFRFNLLRSAAPSIEGIPYSEGSTACVALIREFQIIVGNVGDSRCVLSRSGQAMDLSTDHKPNLPDERLRIENAGGEVKWVRELTFEGGQLKRGCHRVNGIVAMSRAIGDFHYKSNQNLTPAEQMVTCNPDVLTVDITHNTEFLLIASDGIWDKLSSQGAVDFVRQKLAEGTTDLRTICEDLLTRCVESKDNLTVILVWFKHAGRLPHPPPVGISNVASSDADPPLPVSTMPTVL